MPLAAVIDAPPGTVTLVVLVLLIAPVVLGMPAARDMTARGQAGWLWGALTSFALPAGVAAWLYGRRGFPRALLESARQQDGTYSAAVTGPEAHLSPHLLERRDRAREHVDAFVGLSLEQARRLAEMIDVPLKVIRPGAVTSAEYQFGRITVALDAQDRVAQATVSG